MEDILTYCSKFSALEIDNKEVAKKLKEALDELLTSLEITCKSIEMIQKGSFTIDNYNKTKTECLLEEGSKTRSKRLKKLEKEDENKEQEE